MSIKNNSLPPGCTWGEGQGDVRGRVFWGDILVATGYTKEQAAESAWKNLEGDAHDECISLRRKALYWDAAVKIGETVDPSLFPSPDELEELQAKSERLVEMEDMLVKKQRRLAEVTERLREVERERDEARGEVRSQGYMLNSQSEDIEALRSRAEIAEQNLESALISAETIMSCGQELADNGRDLSKFKGQETESRIRILVGTAFTEHAQMVMLAMRSAERKRILSSAQEIIDKAMSMVNENTTPTQPTQEK